MIKLSEKILISVGDKYNHGKKFYMEKPVGTQGFLELGDNGRANRRLARKLKAFMYSDEFGELYTPPNFSDYSFSHAEQEYALKVNAQKVAQGLIFNDKYAAMVTVAVMKKALLRFFDKNTFLFNKFRDYICFSAFDSVGDKYDFIFCLQNRRDISRYDMQIKYNGWDFFLHSFTPDPDESAEKGLERFISNVEYDLKTFDTVIAPFIERERAVELQLFMNGGILVHKGERAPIASTSDSTKKVSEINDLIRRWFCISNEMGEEVAANTIISMINDLDDVNISARSGSTLLRTAVFHDIMPVIKFILDRKEVNVNLGDGEPDYLRGNTPLTTAVARGVELVKLLLDHGADPNLVNAKGSTPIVEASVSTDPAVIELLISRGADPYIAKDDGDNAFDVFVGVPKVIEILKKADQLN